jgi:hypothetical protein
LLADGTVVEPHGDSALLEQIAYVASSLFPEAASPVSAVEIGPSGSAPTGRRRVRLVLEDGSEIDPETDADLARRIDYLAANLLSNRQ